MTNMPKMSARAARALDVLADGGRFDYALERNGYTGREQFQYRLRAHDGSTVKGISGTTFRELRAAGFIGQATRNGFTGSSSSYCINRAGA